MSTIRLSSTALWLTYTARVIAFGLCLLPAPAESQQSPAQYVNLPAEGDLRKAGRRHLHGGSFNQLVGGGTITVRTSTPTACLPPGLRLVLADVAVQFGPVIIQSTHRTRRHNGRAGGARHSLHLSCRAVDMRVRARKRGLIAYLRSRQEVGGLKIYRTGIIHVDNGTRRTW